MSTTLIIIIAVVALLIIWAIPVQNSLVKADELCKNALKQINVQQVSRYDALKALVKLTREYAQYEGDTLQKVIEARKITSSANQSIKGYEENVRLSRMTFNDTVTKYNNQVRMFPGSIVASVLKFYPKEYLAEDTSKTEYPEI